ncbi:MAG TPA: Ohr family peroxiredoxin [Stellaceae bacterium]|nr:Ohr family peroxiredoxin [Stellaceae bacterium]
MRGLRDLFLDIKLPESHPAAEQLFGAAWSACFIGAIEVAAVQKKVKLPATPEIDALIDLNTTGGANFFLRAHLSIKVPGLDREAAQALVDAAQGICPYSKAIHGNIEMKTTLL